MRGLRELFALGVRLYGRNKMGLFYGYMFPSIFLLAFWVLYRHESVPLLRHMGQLLTVTILGGACLGMPTTIVSERERGVWRRYRMTPAPAPMLVASAVGLRFCLVVTAGLLQLALAMVAGMPMPERLLSLAAGFAVVAFSFLGLGLVIATLADNVPAVQALGQCIFLPMLIVGGVAVPLESLPEWALHVSVFFPGRYAVAVLQSAFTGTSAWPAGPDVLSLVLIGAAGLIAGARMFRWDAQQRFAGLGGKGWLALVFAAWAAAGLLSEVTGRVESAPVARNQGAGPGTVQSPVTGATLPGQPVAEIPVAEAPPAAKPDVKAAPYAGPSSWQVITVAEIKRDVDFEGLPPDSGVVTPIARPGLAAPEDVQEQLNALSVALPAWQPGNVADPIQRIRNLMYVAAVPDVLEMSVFESYVPQIVFDRLQQVVRRDDLVKQLYWVATHPSSGEDQPARELQPLGIEKAPADMESVRERVSFYSVKLIGRLIGRIPSR